MTTKRVKPSRLAANDPPLTKEHRNTSRLLIEAALQEWASFGCEVDNESGVVRILRSGRIVAEVAITHEPRLWGVLQEMTHTLAHALRLAKVEISTNAGRRRGSAEGGKERRRQAAEDNAWLLAEAKQRRADNSHLSDARIGELIEDRPPAAAKGKKQKLAADAMRKRLQRQRVATK